MVIFFIFIGITFIISLTSFLLCISTLNVEIKDLLIDSTNKKGSKVENYIIFIRLKIINKLTIFKTRIDKEKIQKYKILNKKIFLKIKEIEKKFLEDETKNLDKESIRIVKYFKFNVDEFDLYLKIGLMNTLFTTISVVLTSTLLSILLAKTSNTFNSNKYLIMPEYSGRSSIKLKLNCIIQIKIIHIINIIYMFIKKKRSVDYNERTSNRRTYASCHD